MKDQSLYYCWFCDAHRLPVLDERSGACCPRCGHELPPEAKLEQPTVPFRTDSRHVLSWDLFNGDSRRAA